MNSQPLVSVVINCFNGEAYLKEAIDSVFAQTYPNWEIVFWDNGSTDSSGKIANSYGDKVRYFYRDKTVPLGEARNLAMKEARGDLVAILDSDDVWDPRHLEKQIDGFWESDCAVCYTAVQEIAKDGSLLREVYINKETGDIFESLLNQFDIYVSTLLMKRDVLVQGGFEFDLEMVGSEEYNLFMRVAAKHKFYIINECLTKWRVHHGSLTSRAISRWAHERVYTLEQLKKQNPGIESKYPEAFKEAYARANYYQARFLVSENDLAGARKALRQVIGVRPIYLTLYLLLFFPAGVWNTIHSANIKHKVVPKILKLLGR